MSSGKLVWIESETLYWNTHSLNYSAWVREEELTQVRERTAVRDHLCIFGFYFFYWFSFYLWGSCTVLSFMASQKKNIWLMNHEIKPLGLVILILTIWVCLQLSQKTIHFMDLSSVKFKVVKQYMSYLYHLINMI